MNKITLVTGAGGYIGGAIAETLAKRGDSVAVCDLNLETAEKTAAKIRENGGDAFALSMDVTDSASVNAAVAAVVEKYGHIDIAVHAAGGSAKIAGPNAEYHDLADQEDFVIDGVFKVNLYGSMYIGRAVGRELRKQGTGGSIVFISSAIGMNGFGGKSEYAAAKGGVIALAKSLAKEMGRYHVTVNTVAPGAVGNVWVKDSALKNNNFLDKRGDAQDIADAVEFISSEKADFITGQTLVVDGGRTLALKSTD